MLKLYVNILKLLNSFKFFPIHATICIVQQAFRIFAIYHFSLHCVTSISHSKSMLSIDTVRIGQFSLTALPLGLVVLRTEDSLTFRFGCNED